MEIIRNNDIIDPSRFANPVVTIGNFDGCHLGHQEIFRRVRKHAADSGGTSVVYTFDPHPASVVKGVTPQLIFTLEEKIRAIESMGMECLVIAPFTREFARTSPEDFVETVICRTLGAMGVVVGHDFFFGNKAHGNITFLKKMGEEKGFFVECVEPVRVDGTVISSTCIRKMLLAGDVAGASSVMMHPFRLSGPVVRGHSRGHSLGFPTANLTPDKELLPGYGVYAVYVYIDGVPHRGVANVGNNPTFGDAGTSIEAFIFDIDCDLYGKHITVEFIENIRGEIKFADKEYLIEQIAADCEQARKILAGRESREGLRHC
ncbi:MAG: bifunctional riboflavin kinase/FAD synthetase [Desulfomonilia bacterium]|nr:bifunctional riboflavin kinase/FAD synthetase [Desulfomonilia bacterium]